MVEPHLINQTTIFFKKKKTFMEILPSVKDIIHFLKLNTLMVLSLSIERKIHKQHQICINYGVFN